MLVDQAHDIVELAMLRLVLSRRLLYSPTAPAHACW